MTTPVEEKAETRRRGSSPSPSNPSGPEAPSGFILKLFQMVNGAPDEVISWTPGGDAFVIGSDLKRLESETLPQYFRHNRFQSLVRQLNFYSFRKINRERNVWIYKHHLFHRDRPDDLHKVRRRTCPGMDGRKQRFSRFSARKLNQNESDDDSQMMDDSSMVDEDSLEGDYPLVKKRDPEMSEFSELSASKRTKRVALVEPPKNEVVVDTPMVPSTSWSPVDETSEDDASMKDSKKDRRVEMIEQSMVVSEVAMKLEEYARKAMKGKGRTRRVQSGIVTPPYGMQALSSSNLLTYDDEQGYESDDYFATSRSLGAVTEGDESFVSEDLSCNGEISPVTPDRKVRQVPPVEDREVADEIVKRIHLADTSDASAAVVSFCMSTAPEGCKDLCSKVLHLIASCEQLAAEFQSYRAALHPINQGEIPTFAFLPSPPNHRATTVQQIWEREASRRDAVRDFKIFAVNCVHKILGKLHSNDLWKNILSESDKLALQRTSEMWQKSACSITV